jgi:hypothetical protein
MELQHMKSQFWKILDHLDNRKQWIYPKLQIIAELMNAVLIVVANVSIGDLKDVAILIDPKDV